MKLTFKDLNTSLTVNDLSEEQKQVINKAMKGKNILVDACIGSGKTTTIQVLCNVLRNKRILYLTYNRLLKQEAKAKIISANATVTNYHGFAYQMLIKQGISTGISDLIQAFNRYLPPIPKYDILIIDEYQDIELELSEMLWHIKETNPNIQIIAVGDMQQKIYDKTTLDVPIFMNEYLGDYIQLQFTQCFRLSAGLAQMLGNVWNKTIVGVNKKCEVDYMNISEAYQLLSETNPNDILCLGSRTGDMAKVLNALESDYPYKFNKQTVYASISDEDRGKMIQTDKTAIFTTFDSSKGLERKICVVFDFSEEYWTTRLEKPFVKYEILRNIFCVAASRGKSKIIFVKNDLKHILSEKTLSTKPLFKDSASTPYAISDMFSFKYKEDIEECFNLLNCIQINRPSNPINISIHDGTIDLSPCVGIYQEASFFDKYDIDSEISFSKSMHRDRFLRYDNLNKATLEEKILYLTAFETYHDRYITQVSNPFVSPIQSRKIHERLKTQFTPNETVQVECSITLDSVDKKICNIKGRADVVKDNTVYELKFISELNHEHFLQCACYMIALGLDDGKLWNVRTNEMYSIKIPNKEKFINSVAKAITKGQMTKVNKIITNNSKIINTVY